MSWLEVLKALPTDVHWVGCDRQPKPEPHQALGRLVAHMIEGSGEVKRRPDCRQGLLYGKGKLCPFLTCWHCDSDRAEWALYMYRGGDFTRPSCCIRGKRMTRHTMSKMNNLAAHYGLPLPYFVRRLGRRKPKDAEESDDI